MSRNRYKQQEDYRPAKVLRRAGSVLIGVLVCIGVASAILAGITTSALRERRQVRRELQMEQTRWLLEAGFVYASKKCVSDPDYRGETIQLSPALTDRLDTVVVINVSDSVDGSKRLSVTAKMKGTSPSDQPTQRSGTASLVKE